jgi:phage-related protein
MLGRGPIAFGPLAALTGFPPPPTTGHLAHSTMAQWRPLATAEPLAGPYQLSPLTLAATGTVRNQIFTGTLGVTLGALNPTLTGKVTVQGTAAGTLFPVVLIGTGTVVNHSHGTLAQTLGPLALSGSAGVLVQGTLGATSAEMVQWTPLASAKPLAGPFALGSLALAAAGTATNHVFTGTLAATLSPLALAGAGSITGGVISSGVLAATLDTLTLRSNGKAYVKGKLSATLGGLTLAGVGHITTARRTGTLGITLDALTLQASGGISVLPTSWPHEWCPAPGAARTSTLAVDVVQFGDGYCHRSTRGLDPVRPTMSYQFPFVGMGRLNDMNAFLKANGARGFQFQPPDSDGNVFVTADAWSASITDKNLTTDVVGTLQATFVQQFNPQPLNVP